MLKYFSVQNKMADFYITLYVKQFNNEHNKFESMKMIYSFAQNNLDFFFIIAKMNKY